MATPPLPALPYLLAGVTTQPKCTSGPGEYVRCYELVFGVLNIQDVFSSSAMPQILSHMHSG